MSSLNFRARILLLTLIGRDMDYLVIMSHVLNVGISISEQIITSLNVALKKLATGLGPIVSETL